MPTKAETETIVNYDLDQKIARFYTTNRSHIRKLREDDRVKETSSGGTEDDPWAFFETVEPDTWNPLSGLKRRSNMSDERRAEMSALAKERFGKAGADDAED